MSPGSPPRCRVKGHHGTHSSGELPGALQCGHLGVLRVWAETSTPTGETAAGSLVSGSLPTLQALAPGADPAEGVQPLGGTGWWLQGQGEGWHLGMKLPE